MIRECRVNRDELAKEILLKILDVTKPTTDQLASRNVQRCVAILAYGLADAMIDVGLQPAPVEPAEREA